MKFFTTLLFSLIYTFNFAQADSSKIVTPTKTDTIAPTTPKVTSEDSIKKIEAAKTKEQDSIKNVNFQLVNAKLKIADSVFLDKNLTSANILYLETKLLNTKTVNNKEIETKINAKLAEISLILSCHKNLDSATILMKIQKYEEALDLIKLCTAYDTLKLAEKIQIEIKRIKDSIQFEAYLVQIKAETDSKEFIKSLETIKKAKELKTSPYLVEVEIANQKMVAIIQEKNLKRYNDYRVIQENFVLYKTKADSLSIKLNAIKEKYRVKFDTCVGHVKSQYKETLKSVKAHPDFDPIKNEFKITDYWDDSDEALFILLDELKTKTNYHFKFIDKIEKIILSGENKELKNFTKYVYIKDIVYVFMLEK